MKNKSDNEIVDGVKVMVILKYDIEKNLFIISGNVKKDKVKEVISNYLITQFGAGVDDRKPAELDVYEIGISLDLSDDSFSVAHDCGNKGLRDGILAKFLTDESTKEWENDTTDE